MDIAKALNKYLEKSKVEGQLEDLDNLDEYKGKWINLYSYDGKTHTGTGKHPSREIAEQVANKAVSSIHEKLKVGSVLWVSMKLLIINNSLKYLFPIPYKD